jgi:hypothetical protein
MENAETPEEPIIFKGLLDAIHQLEPTGRMDIQDALVAFIDNLYRASCVVFDQGVEPRGFASSVEERAVAVVLSVLLNITGASKDGMVPATNLYLDILDEVQREPVYAYDILVRKSTNPATMDGQLFPCETDPDPEFWTTRDPNSEPGIKRRPTPGE